MIKRQYIIWLLCLLFSQVIFAQSPYQLSWKKELPYIGIGLGSLGAATYYQHALQPYRIDELPRLNSMRINAFDRFAIKNFSTPADQLSNVLLVSANLSPYFFLGHQRTRRDFGKIMALYGEATAINLGFTYLAKSIFPRARPFVYNDIVREEIKLTRNAKSSFFSGHTSVTAMNTFFAASVFSDYFPESKWKSIVWGTAVLVPAITAYSRVKAGKHFPSDVITGYAVGAGIGMLIPYLHRRKGIVRKGPRVQLGYQSAYVNWKF